MKLCSFLLLATLCVAGTFGFPERTRHLLGSKKCTWGPSYWCSNLTAAAGCKAVKHCIQTVWEKKVYPEDNDSVCQTCISMVKQARDQLESNETQEEIKEVFEGSCKLIPIKIVSKECCDLADQFIPELVETLASQMNPSVVCSVAGLCNNENIDVLLKDTAVKPSDVQTTTMNDDTCSGCYKVVNIMEDKFGKMSRDDFLQELLHVCGRMGSFSDACSNIIITYFTNIYSHVKENFNSRNICLMSGECSTNFHVHDIEVTPLAKIGVVNVNDDLPCDLCKQLVGHLRDLLIANTTEDEFQKVLQGLCKQTQGFKDECLGIVNEYYPVIYNFLVSELNSTQVCSMVGICPSPTSNLKINPIIPLLPVEVLSDKLLQKTLNKVQIPNNGVSIKIVNNKQFEQQQPEMMQLPIERLGSPSLNAVYNKELCAFCEYFLHYLQQALTDPKTEDSIKDTIDKACMKLPRSINQTCVEFVNTYSDALVAILAQEIDPSTVCPMMHICPASKLGDVEVFMQGPTEDKPNCPLCLFAVTKLEEMVKGRKSRENIKSALSTLCDHLSGNLIGECKDFVQSYTDELVEMLMDDFKPQEVCVYLKLCKDNLPAPDVLDINVGGVVITNEILDFTANGKVVKPLHKSFGNKPECPLCEFVMEKVENAIKDKTNEDEIKQVIHGICNHLPHTLRTDCNNFVDQYADMVLQLLVASVKPSEICAVMNLCDKENKDHTLDEIEGPIQDDHNLKSPLCFTCKLVLRQIEHLISKNISEEQVINALDYVCYVVPGESKKDCIAFLDKYRDVIYNILVEGTDPGEICSLIMICDTKQMDSVKSYINKCAVCDTAVLAFENILKNPKADHSIEHVLEKGCRALPFKHQKTCKKLIEEKGKIIFELISHTFDTGSICKEIGVCSNIAVRPKREERLGAKKCTWGPSYWCEKAENADECGHGARSHCEEHVWKGPAPKINV